MPELPSIPNYTQEEIKAILPHLTDEERAELDSLLMPVASSDVLEGGWRKNYESLFGQVFTDGLAPHHIEGIEWHWESRLAFLQGKQPQYDAYFPIWSRAHNKSGIARRIAVVDGILSFQNKTPAYILYVSRNKDMALKHAKSVETLLQSKRVKAVCPEIAEVQRNDQKRSKGWTASFIYTKANVIYHFAGLDEGLAGGNIETNVEEVSEEEDFRPDVRVTLFVPDDIDGREDSPVIAESRFKTLTNEVLPMGQENSLVFFAQNLISRYSCMYRIWKQQARVLTGRKPTQPVKAVLDLVTKTKVVGGIVQDVYVSGASTWPVWDAHRIQKEINRFGLPAFLRECQHEVEQDREGLVLQNWNDSVHVISYSQFAAVFGTRELPFSWFKYVFNDWARTKTKYHANVAGILTVSAQNTRLPGCVFLFHPMSFPPGSAPEDVAERLLTTITPKVRVRERWWAWRELIGSTLKKTNLEHLLSDITKLIKERRSILADVIPKLVKPLLKAQHYRAFRGSHDQNTVGRKGQDVGALEVMRTVFGLPFEGVNPGGDGGVDRINLLQKTDYSVDHPFKQGEKGFSNYYLVTEDDTTQEPIVIDSIEVYPPIPCSDVLSPDDLHDAQLARYQFKNCRFRDPKLTEAGEKGDGEILKANDDFLNGHMFFFYDDLLQAAPLTYGEKIRAVAPQIQTLEEKFKDGPLSETEQLQYHVAMGDAKERLGRSGNVQAFDPVTLQPVSEDWR